MELSGNAVKKLGKRLRTAEMTEADRVMLDAYRASFEPLLVTMSMQVDGVLTRTGIPYLVCGRSKRTKSIIRKLRRTENRSMDLSRVSDMVGLRVLVETAGQQQQVLDQLCGALTAKDVDDYRTNVPPSGYRCVHIIARDGSRLLEIQLRTLAQHLWAVESESFGEKVKEGSGTAGPAVYLQTLSTACRQVDEGQEPYVTGTDVPLMMERKPLTGQYPKQVELFRAAARCESREAPTTSYLIVFDRQLGELVHNFAFGADARDEAIREYSKFCRTLDETRMDVLILNSPSRSGIEVTHPQFF